MKIHGFLVEKVVPYIQEDVCLISETGETQYDKISDDSWEKQYAENMPERWLIHREGSYFDEMGDDDLTFEELKEYLEYEDGWLETHEEHDRIGWYDWKHNIKGEK